MPRLDETAAEKVATAEATGGLMAEGTYEMILNEVKVGKGEKGPYWTWEFVVPADAPKYAKQRQWLNTSLSEASAWRLKEVFAAFGATPDTDTDDLLGQRVRVQVGVSKIQKGPRTGDDKNEVRSVKTLDGGANSDGDSGSGSVF